MKTLIISDDDSVIQKINSKVQSLGFDTIIYRWLLKALDNLEEISPEYIIVSVKDYPRHWKTLAQFVQMNLARVPAKVILYSPEKLSVDEEKKSSALNIFGTINSIDENGLNELQCLLKENSSLKTEIKKKGSSGGLLSRIENLYG